MAMQAINSAILSKQALSLAGVEVEYLPEIQTTMCSRVENAKVYVDGQQVACYIYSMHKVVRTIGVEPTGFISRVWGTLDAIDKGLKAYLNHGSHEYRSTGRRVPLMTESVECKEVLLPHHKAGLSYTSTGYGNKIPTRYMVRVDNGLAMRWYRVYSTCHSNVSTEYIVMRGTTIIVDLEVTS